MKVHYFAGYGRAEAFRMLLHHAKVEYENVNYTPELLAEAKTTGNLEFGQLPVFETEGKFYAQSVAILRFLGIKYGYYPTDAYQGWEADSIIDSVGDLTNAFYKCVHITDPEEQKAAFGVFYETTFVRWLDAMQKRLKANGSQSHIVGDKWSIADFMMASVAYGTFLNDHSAS